MTDAVRFPNLNLEDALLTLYNPAAHKALELEVQAAENKFVREKIAEKMKKGKTS